jgi:putative FmdB family regulatory protein
VPRYDYKCESCGSIVEFERGIGEDRDPSCCFNIMTRIWNSAPGIIFNSSDFYSTDSRK